MRRHSRLQGECRLTFVSIAGAAVLFCLITGVACGNQTASPVVRFLVCDSAQVPDTLVEKGNVVACVRYRDNGGEYIIVVSEYTQGEYFTKGYVSEIYVSAFQKDESVYKRVWRIWDTSNSISGTVAYERGTLLVFDVDGDGYAESRFLYTIVFEGADPWKVKYMLHYKGKKYAIRGEVPVEYEPTQYKKVPDDAFRGAPESIRNFALKDWDKLVSKHFDVPIEAAK